jgi:DNA mismatch repair protein MutL
MSDIIHLLPDSVANQIAAGEVIQRPASVIKELVENALDAEATDIRIIIKDAGRTLIQVVDNGKGMSETDARMAFERHATSKIAQAADLFELKTMGFRGEALASIAAVAQVELKTRKEEQELGTLLEIAGSKVEKQELIHCPVGSNFSVKNLFFNVPARRKFLKSNATEFNHILTEFNRVAIIYPHISFSLFHNDTEIYQLPPCPLRQRIVAIFGKSINTQLLPVEVKTGLVGISGFVGKPESARKQMHNQYFFVNGRYMRHPYFHKAVLQAFDRMLPAETSPSYFLSFQIDPSAIDVNIHPTKTEIKFENEQAIWAIILSGVKEALGKFNVVPGIDFDQAGAIEIPLLKGDMEVSVPKTTFNPDYNPFKSTSSAIPRKEPMDWGKLYEGFEKQKAGVAPAEEISADLLSALPEEKATTVFSEAISTTFLQLNQRYIATGIKSGLMVTDQHRAHIRILFEEYLKAMKQRKGISQQLLFPEILELSPEDNITFSQIKNELYFAGFDIEPFGKNTYAINGIPSSLESSDCVKILQEIIAASKEKTADITTELHQNIALSLAKATATPYGKTLSPEEMEHLINRLFACENYNYTPDGKTIFSVIGNEEIEKRV